MDKLQFANLAAANIRNNFSGDPLALTPFIRSINYLNDLADSDQLKKQLKNFVLTKLEGYASEIVPEETANVEAIIKCLKEKIKPENSKIVEGRMLALKVNKNGIQDFVKQVEDLSDAFRRALVNDDMPHNLAEKQVIDKTIELCRANSRNETVKAVLSASKFDTPKEVVAKFIVESNTTKQEAQINAFRKFQNGNGQNTNFRDTNHSFYDRGNNSGSYNNDHVGRNSQNTGNYFNRSNGRGSQRGQNDKNINVMHEYQNEDNEFENDDMYENEPNANEIFDNENFEYDEMCEDEQLPSAQIMNLWPRGSVKGADFVNLNLNLCKNNIPSSRLTSAH